MKRARAALPRAPLWDRDAIIYELRTRSYYDSNNDGVGDLRGLTMKLDYLADLGVTAIWMLPHYPSPGRDDGYDVADYTSIHPEIGALDDFDELVEEAHLRGIRIVTELVVNHTSDQYLNKAGDAPFISRDRGVTELLLESALLDQTLRDRRFELLRRSPTVAVPMHGILDVLGRDTV